MVAESERSGLNNFKPKNGPGRTRGLPKAQYLSLYRMVKAGETTWAELERRGIVLPVRRLSEFRRAVQKQLGR